MAKFIIQIERVIREKESQTIEAETLSDALMIAHAAYCSGPTEEQPYSYDWEDCGDVEEIEVQHLNDGGELLHTCSFVQAELGEFDE